MPYSTREKQACTKCVVWKCTYHRRNRGKCFQQYRSTWWICLQQVWQTYHLYTQDIFKWSSWNNNSVESISGNLSEGLICLGSQFRTELMSCLWNSGDSLLPRSSLIHGTPFFCFPKGTAWYWPLKSWRNHISLQLGWQCKCSIIFN